MNKKRRLSNAHLWLILIVGTALMVGVTIGIGLVVPTPSTGLLVYDAGEWQAVTASALRAPTLVQVAPDEIIWVLTDSRLYRADRFYEGQIWRYYTIQAGDTLTSIANDFDTTKNTLLKSNNLIHDDDLMVGEHLWIPRPEPIRVVDDDARMIGRKFVAMAGAAWAASDDALWYFDGQTWIPAEAWAGFPLLGLTTDGTSLWYLDSAYWLTHYTTDDVQTYHLQELGFGDVVPTEEQPVLATLLDGPVFVVGEYLLRLDADGPSRHLTEAVSIQYVGVADNQLWLLVDGVLQTTTDGDTWRTVALPDAGLHLNDVVVDGQGRTWLAAEDGIWMQPPDGAWRRVYETDKPVTSITLGAYEQLWATTAPDPRPSWVLILAVVGAIGIIGFSLLGVLMLLSARMVGGDRQRTRHILEDKLPDLAPSVTLSQWEQGWRKWVVTLVPIAVFSALALGLLILVGLDGFDAIGKGVEDWAETLWPNGPEWFRAVLMDVLLSGVLFLLGVPLALWAIWRTKEPEKRSKLRRNFIGGGVMLFLYPLFTNFLEYGAESTDDMGLLLVAACGLMGVLGIAATVLLIGGVLVAARDVQHGRYDKIIRNAAKASQLPIIPAPNLWMHGTALMMIGRFAEAEPLLRRSIAEGEKSPLFQTNLYSALENLGQTLTGLERYAEAVGPLEASIELRPQGSWNYLRMAENYLFQGKEPETALALLATAERNKKRAIGGGRYVDRFVFAEIAADRAWAYAMLSHYLEADAAVEVALKRLPKHYQPVQGGLYWRLGEVMRLRKDRRAAQRYWEQSLAIDPDGPFSQRARDGLAGFRGSW